MKNAGLGAEAWVIFAAAFKAREEEKKLLDESSSKDLNAEAKEVLLGITDVRKQQALVKYTRHLADDGSEESMDFIAILDDIDYQNSGWAWRTLTNPAQVLKDSTDWSRSVVGLN